MDNNTATPANAAAAPPIPEATLDDRIFAFPRNGDNMFRCEHGHCLSCRECPHGCVDSDDDDEDRCEHGHSFSGGCTWGCYANEDEGEDAGEDEGEDAGGKIEMVEYFRYEPSDGGYGEAMCDNETFSEASGCNFRNPGCTHGTCDECVDEAHEYERIDNFHSDRSLERRGTRHPGWATEDDKVQKSQRECQEAVDLIDRELIREGQSQRECHKEAVDLFEKLILEGQRWRECHKEEEDQFEKLMREGQRWRECHKEAVDQFERESLEITRTARWDMMYGRDPPL